jgi:hypothetical protein
MKIKQGKEESYKKFIEINNDPYSLCVVRFMKHWAELMEQQIELGKNVADIARETEIQADTEGITGFMYGCAVNALIQFWEYGEQLKDIVN